MRQELGRNTGAGIAHDDFEVRVGHVQSHLHQAVAGCEADCIRDQIPNYLLKTIAVFDFTNVTFYGNHSTTGVGAALNTAGVEPGSTVAVIGCGGVGQAVIQGARIAGASRIIAVDPVEMKRKTAESVGATDFVDPSEGDPVAQVQQLTSGRGVDYAFEVIGLPETTLQAYNMIRKGGTAVMVGMTRAEAEVTIPTFDLFFNEKTLKGCKYGSGQVRRDFQRFADLIETGRLDTESMVSRTIKLDEVNRRLGENGEAGPHQSGRHQKIPGRGEAAFIHRERNAGTRRMSLVTGLYAPPGKLTMKSAMP
jgi:Zn-dependent alcohol dehydrogenase